MQSKISYGWLKETCFNHGFVSYSTLIFDNRVEGQNVLAESGHNISHVYSLERERERERERGRERERERERGRGHNM